MNIRETYRDVRGLVGRFPALTGVWSLSIYGAGRCACEGDYSGAVGTIILGFMGGGFVQGAIYSEKEHRDFRRREREFIREEAELIESLRRQGVISRGNI